MEFLRFISPATKNILHLDSKKEIYRTSDGSEEFKIKNKNIISFLLEHDDFYEGAYLNRVHFVPKSEKWYHVLPLWLISNGYLWNVRKYIPKDSVVLELGCASGIDYFGTRYQMIGIDLSLTSLKNLHNYRYAIQADASNLPLQDNSVDGIISSYFWEHIPPQVKEHMLLEFKRVLKPGGKVVFLYDVETNNSFINILKNKNIDLYSKLFLEKDGHLGYETPDVNKNRFEQHGFRIIKHFGMERTWIQSLSVYEKYRHLSGWEAWIGKVGYIWSKFRVTTLINILFVRIIDETIGRLFSFDKSRILISVLEKRNTP